MNTPGHIVLNLLVVGRGTGRPWKPILLGALLPDLPMLLFYAIERGLIDGPAVRRLGLGLLLATVLFVAFAVTVWGLLG